MRISIAIAAVTLLGLCVCAEDARAQATNLGSENAHAQQAAREAKDRPPKADEQAYQDALKRGPAPKKADPWGNMR
jgi:hypothetical protein